jgi:hypothetical protein
MNRDKFTSMIEDAHRNKVLHLVKLFMNENGYVDQFYNYVRMENNEPETLAILKTIGIKEQDLEWAKTESTIENKLKGYAKQG